MVTDWEREPRAHLVVQADGGERKVAIFDQLFIGRECAGIRENRRLVFREPGVSRNHCEIRLDPVTDQAFIIDTSTNGTLLNGARLERAVLVAIKPNDEIRIGDVALTFRSDRFKTVPNTAGKLTEARIFESTMVMVVGDIINYSTISEVADNRLIAESLNHLWHELGTVLRVHRGTLNHYAGDALYAVWELQTLPEANELAVDFALAANQKVEEIGPKLPLRDPHGSPIGMGWGVVQGTAAIAAMTRSVEAVIGDATNVAFRLAGIAGRAGYASVMVTDAVHAAVEAHYVWGQPAQVEIKGRSGTTTVYPVIARTGP
ncbi:adenylate cyclase [Mycobacterium kansasii]|nr:adenylate cyclase [Mycobacterium kansasii]